MGRELSTGRIDRPISLANRALGPAMARQALRPQMGEDPVYEDS